MLGSLTIRLLISLIFLQIACLGLFAQDIYGDSLSSRELVAICSRRSLSGGEKLLNFSVYTELSHRQDAYSGQRRATLIISGCDCQIDRINNLAEVVSSRGENVVLIVQKRPEELPALRHRYNIHIRLVAIRQNDLRAIFGSQQLPIIVHISPDGEILAIEH